MTGPENCADCWASPPSWVWLTIDLGLPVLGAILMVALMVAKRRRWLCWWQTLTLHTVKVLLISAPILGAFGTWAEVHGVLYMPRYTH